MKILSIYLYIYINSEIVEEFLESDKEFGESEDLSKGHQRVLTILYIHIYIYIYIPLVFHRKRWNYSFTKLGSGSERRFSGSGGLRPYRAC